MRWIDADVLIDGYEDNYEFCEAVNNTPTVPAIPLERIKQLMEEVGKTESVELNGSDGFKNGFHGGYDYKRLGDLVLINNMIKEYEERPVTPKDHKTSNDQQRSPEFCDMDDYMTDCMNCHNRKKCMEYMGG